LEIIIELLVDIISAIVFFLATSDIGTKIIFSAVLEVGFTSDIIALTILSVGAIEVT